MSEGAAAGLTELRAGRPGRGALFVIPGAGGQARELAALAAALPDARPVLACEPWRPDAQGRCPATVEDMAAHAAASIRLAQPTGPYLLLGYSFGGLVAVEAARRLEAAGQTVLFLGLVDAVYDRRYWPADLFVSATLRRASHHLGRALRRPWREAGPELAARAGRLLGRLAGRLVPPRVERRPQAEASASDVALAAMAGFRPRRCQIPTVFFASRPGAEFGCDPAELWRDLAGKLTVRRIDASHLDLVRAPAALGELARGLDAALAAAEAPRRPRAMLVSSVTWIATSRLAISLRNAGFVVEAVCPRRHSLARLGLAEAWRPYDVLRPRRGLALAVAEARPDIVIPTDDRAAQALHGVHRAADPDTLDGAALRARLVRSLGPAESQAAVYSRPGVMALAREAGLPAPMTTRVRSAADLEAWVAAHGLPAVLKTDGSWGGRDLAFLHDHAGAISAFRRMNAPPHPLRALKRLLVEGDIDSLRACLLRRRPRLSVQAFARGAPGNIAVACLDGQVLAAVCVEVVQSQGLAGPATVVRVADHPGMRRAAETVASGLRLTGLIGLDFVLDPETGAAQLIELNPRATPTAHLLGADGADLAAGLAAGLARRPVRMKPRPRYAGGLVALFPQELRRDPDSPHLRAAHHDVPWDEPDLVELALAGPRTVRAAFERLSSPQGR